MRLALWETGGMGSAVVRVVPVLVTSFLWLACSLSGPTGAADGTDHLEVWEIKNDDTTVDGWSSGDVLDLRGEVLRFDVKQVPETCSPANAVFGCPCNTNTDCASGWCVLHLGEKICSEECLEECPDGWDCWQATGFGGDVVFVCISRHPALCLPCFQSTDCTGENSVCLQFGPEEGAFCASVCGECPPGYSCIPGTATEGEEGDYCRPDNGVCECTDFAAQQALKTPCATMSELGMCFGWRTCTPQGLSLCNAPGPEEEVCDGVDNDCNGATDEAQDCDDLIQCTLDVCNGAGGCAHEPLSGTPCYDGDACTYDDHCDAGECVSSPLECSDDNACTDDTCDPIDGCVFVPNQSPCADDGDPCSADVCQAGTCIHEPGNDGAACADDGDPCSADVCQAGACVHEPGNDGAPCNDDDPCTLEDHCKGGLCMAADHDPSCLGACGDGKCVYLESAVTCPVDCGPCGDGICGTHEAGPGGGSCPVDCLAACGDGLCQGGESVTLCPIDCGGCGDGLCGLNEGFDLCAADCAAPCGNDICEGGENPVNCAPDCQPPCGDGLCDWGENSVNCLADCTVCGDKICGGEETLTTCPADCATACGNGLCEAGEASETCLVDCGYCGDDVCGYAETGTTCPADCALSCGDQFCVTEQGETIDNCPADCALDLDGDLVSGAADNCPFSYNPDQTDGDGDGLGDACDADDDNDGEQDFTDCAPFDPQISHFVKEVCNDLDDDCDDEVDDAPEGGPALCDDQVDCTEDACLGAAGCTHLPADELCDDGNSCTIDSCIAQAGCVHPTLPDGAKCGPSANWSCQQGECLCVSDCTGKVCGDDGCGEPCGTCGEGMACLSGACEAQVCAGLNGFAHVVFVSPLGEDGPGAGSMEMPYRTIGAAIGAAALGGPPWKVYAAGGDYPESVTLADGISLCGGYVPELGWSRDASNQPTHVHEEEGGAWAVMAFEAHGITQPTRVDGLFIEAGANSQAGGSSVGIWITGSSAQLVYSDNRVKASNGASGVTGAKGMDGESAKHGNPGFPGCEYDGGPVVVCGDCDRPDGGDAGKGECGNGGGTGGRGGENDSKGESGTEAEDGTMGGAGGDSAKDGQGGTHGDPGGTGNNGDGGDGFGAAGDLGQWGPSPGKQGENGTDGRGGGGGGGGGGDSPPMFGFGCYTYGGSGGGGGGGGCGGAGGKGGQGGGGAVGILVVNSTPVLQGNTIERGKGGNGGAGGLGGTGGLGGNGNAGGIGNIVDDEGAGGSGGNGGGGGNGGAGGGGSGGVSVGILWLGDIAPTCIGNVFPGNGGGGPGGPSSGYGGQNGITADLYPY